MAFEPFKVLVMTPSSGLCRIQYAISLANLAMYFNRAHVYPEIKMQGIKFKYYEGTGVSQNREDCVDSFLESDDTHLFFIDDDMGFNWDVLHSLAQRRLPIVGCNYRMRRPPARFMAIRYENDKPYEIRTEEKSKGLEEVHWMGLGMTLIHRSVFESLAKPRFQLEWQEPTENTAGHYSTEDFVFYRRVREAGFPIYLDHDTSKKIYHNGNIAYMWNDDYSNLNKNLIDPDDERLKEKKE